MKRHSLWLACVSLCVLVPADVRAQCGAPAWSAMNEVGGANARVSALTSWDPDGAGPAPALVVAGGAFTLAGGAFAPRIAAWDGASWTALGSGMGPSTAVVDCLAVFQGELIAGGTFASAGGVAASNIARWNGSSWLPLGGGLDHRVRALAVWNGALFAAGFFASAGGVPAAGIARWDGSAWQSVSQLGVAPGERIHALTNYNGELVAAGRFSLIDGTPASNVARWNGNAWSPLGSGIAQSGNVEPVRALEVFGGRLIAGGEFPSAGGGAAANVAAWDGVSWQPLGTGMNAPVTSLRTFGAELIAGGTFSAAGSVSAKSLARWDGTGWSPVISGTTPSPLIGGISPVDALYAAGGVLYAGGSFVTVGGIYAVNVARWDGSAWSPMGARSVQGGGIQALASTDAGLVAGGYFSLTGSLPSYSVSRWDGGSEPLGTGLPLLSSVIGFGVVRALATAGGDIVAAGSFSVSAPNGGDEFARWNGSAWQALPPGGPSSGHSLERHGGAIAAGGDSVATWDGSAWTPLGTAIPSPFGESGVFAMKSVGGLLVAGGNFISIGGGPVSNIAAWNGATWAPVGAGRAATVRVLAVYNGELIAGGDQDSAGSAIERWNGSAWVPLGGGVSSSLIARVNALEVWNGELIAGGLFTQAGTATVSNIARWNGSSWAPLGGGTDGEVRALRVHEGGLVAAGSFTSADGVVSPSVARWSSPLPVVRVTQPMGAGTPVAVADRGLVAGHEYFNIVSGDLCPGGPGTGPVGGLCFNDINALVAQLLVPVGAVPFHFVASAPAMSFGPYALPSGLAFEVLCFDATGGVVGCIGPVQRFVAP